MAETNAVKQEPLVTDDLTGWTWVGNETLSLSLEGYYQINFVSTRYADADTDEWEYLFSFSGVTPLGYENDSIGVDITVYNDSGWENGADTIHITGGAQVTDTDLIRWLQDNGRLTPPQPQNITLDLSTIGLSEGTHSIQMKLSGGDKRDSALSNAVSYTVITWEYPVEDGDNLIITQANTITEDGDYLIIE